MTVAQLRNLINTYIRNYPVGAFQDGHMNTVLNIICDFLTGSGGGGDSGATKVVSANFTDATHCPLTAFNGDNLSIYWNDANKFLTQGTDFDLLVGGGFNMTVPAFDSTTANFTFYVFIQTN